MQILSEDVIIFFDIIFHFNHVKNKLSSCENRLTRFIFIIIHGCDKFVHETSINNARKIIFSFYRGC